MVSPTSDDRPLIAGRFRPPRAFTIGRRKSDRWLAYVSITLMVVMMFYIVYTGFQQNQAADRAAAAEVGRQEIIARLETQNRDLICFARNTQTFEVAVSNYLVAQPNIADDPEVRLAIEEIRARLREAQAIQDDSTRVENCFEPPR